MQLTPSPSTRFSDYLTQHYLSFRQALYRCQIGSKRYQIGDPILQQGQAITQLVIVPVGRVSMHICAVNGRRFQLGEMDCNYNVFGEMEFFTKTQCQWSVVVEEAIEIDILDIKKVEKLLLEHPEFSLFFASALALDYQDSLDIYTYRLLHPITYNIAFDLLQHARRSLTLGRFNKVDKEAERFGTSSRVYRRALKTLIQQGLVEKKGTELIILDLIGLQKFVDHFEDYELS
ncbi:Crp/Fnr family transcriptional regulator [Photobacterium kishitanii]|uniref:Crp/Fnr family transcriptional regulator n=1 Tax=Photobacterium kishitanii TaxID=318456 RepID=A0A0B7JGV6_9GAMM|nr:Crp/Fnr family transcriptional regulator [Photobacterium kishitanii]OBU27935.1 Crp/Fnr family transcriptional regulator [Photobacterium kishitanii]PSU91650.1 Crp/Fnr family transcriptional regulator [Photobacterium kishitanii]PSU92884.1 Crp/Fnr family transcriptional regulator [Photobacterium kishitanii]PSV00087.1 Crp/Fnr family transcriptional regulator [Photobacterium kishitanii]PSW71072.1 Crp/Fnr family transcriptional regulator [Photobacterium kishitanii]